MVKNNQNIMMIFIIILSFMLFMSIFYSCKCNMRENFEDVTMKPKKKETVLSEEEIKKIADSITNETDTQDIIEKVKAHINNKNGDKTVNPETEKTTEDDTDTAVEKEDKEIVLSKKETELFNAIKKDNINNDELDRLVKSGVVNEDMIMRFLQKMEENEDKNDVEEFTSCGKKEGFSSCGKIEGFSSCARDYATF